MFTPTQIALAIVLPFVVSMAVIFIGARLKRRLITLGGVGVTAGFLIGYIVLRRLPTLPPLDGTDWTFYAAVVAGFFSLVARPMVLRIALGIVAVLAGAMQVASEVKDLPWLMTAGTMAAVYLTFALRELRPPVAVMGVGLMAASAAVVLNAGSISAFQVGMSLASASSAAMVATWFPSLRQATAGWTAPAATAMTAILVGRGYSDHTPQMLPLMLLLLAALLPWALELKAFRGRRVWIIVVLGALLGAAASIPQVLRFVETSTTVSDYGY